MNSAVRPMGPTAALVECEPGAAAHLALGAAARGVAPGRNGVVEVVPAARTLLIECTDPGALAAALGIIDALLGEDISWAHSDGSGRTDPEQVEQVEIAVRFDGPDLSLVAERCGLRPDEVVEAVVSSHLEVAFCGFAPGFAYLTGLDPVLHLPRRDHPRPRVERGSFAVAAGYAAVYPSSSPGGWHLLGSTRFEVWSLGRRPPAVLRPGTMVRIAVEHCDGVGAERGGSDASGGGPT